jgi:CheY-like chemotaxis protein
MGSASRLAGRTILIVEDEPLIALDVHNALTEAGAKVVSSATMPDAVKHVARGDFSAAVLDIHLHERDCEGVCNALHWRGVPFVFYTGYTDASVIRSWPDAPVLAKPASAERIVATLAKLRMGAAPGA